METTALVGLVAGFPPSNYCICGSLVSGSFLFPCNYLADGIDSPGFFAPHGHCDGLVAGSFPFPFGGAVIRVFASAYLSVVVVAW